jgi:hypothetical protein
VIQTVLTFFGHLLIELGLAKLVKTMLRLLGFVVLTILRREHQATKDQLEMAGITTLIGLFFVGFIVFIVTYITFNAA